MGLSAGSRLGPYEILGPLGAGGMGEVYEARDPRLDRRVAVKVLRSDVATDPDRLARFEREARAVAAINHPNIVTLYGIEEADGIRFLAMERIEGRALSELIEPDGLPMKKILDWAIPIADALAAAHAHGVVHRDLKPGNVMINDEGRPKILDFGLARVSAPSSSPSPHTESVTEAMTAQGNIFGTVPYMAPEQLRGERADARADIFAFGAMLYEMACGRRPFIGATGAEVVASILKEDPPPLEGIRTDLPAAFVRIVGRCLEKDPRERLQSAADLQHELSDVAEEIRTRPGGVAIAAPRNQPLTRRRWGRAAALAAVLLAGAALLLILKPFGSKPGLARPIESLAVLPLKNYSGDASQDYFADGMTDALIANLAQIRALKVISRTSAMRYRDSKKPISQIARELGVEGIVEGSVVRAGSRVRVTAQLINAEQDRHVWASNYEREMTDILSLQSEIVRAVAGEIRVQVTAQENVRLGASRPVDPVVYDTTLRAVSLLEHAIREEEVRRAIAMFQSAVARDPGYAPAWAGLGYAHVWIYMYGTELGDPKKVSDQAVAATEKALALEPELAEAHWARAGVAYNSAEWDFAKAQHHFERALELRPGYAYCHLEYAAFLVTITHDFEKARIHMDRGRVLDPFSLYGSALQVGYMASTGHAEQAAEEGHRLLREQPDNWIVLSITGRVNIRLERFDEAVRDFEGFLEKALPERPFDILGELGLAYGLAGRRADARKILLEMEQASARVYVCPLYKALLHIGLGQNDEAYRLLEKALEERAANLVYQSMSPIGLDTWFKDPRWPGLKARILRAVRMPGDAKPGGNP